MVFTWRGAVICRARGPLIGPDAARPLLLTADPSRCDQPGPAIAAKQHMIMRHRDHFGPGTWRACFLFALGGAEADLLGMPAVCFAGGPGDCCTGCRLH